MRLYASQKTSKTTQSISYTGEIVMTHAQNSKKHGKFRKVAAIIAVIIFVGGGWWSYTEGRPWYYGVRAYIYGFPLVVMDVTREVSTAVSVPGELSAPVNQFSVMTHYPDASFRFIPRTGLDTLFALSWADLDKEPLVLSVPDTQGRYYVIALFDMWSNVFESIGSRTTGTDAGMFLLAGPGWQGTPPAGIKKVIKSPTRYVWVNAQMRADGPQDYDVVNALQRQYKLTPLSAWGTPWMPPAEVAVDTGANTSPPMEQVQQMDANAFFGRLAKLMKDNPPFARDKAMVQRLKAIGIEPGKDFDINNVDTNIARALKRAMVAHALLEKGVKILKTAEGWIVVPDNFANYGTDYMTRAGIALIGLGGIWPKDILYPVAFLDSDDKPLDAENHYVLHLGKGQLPPAKATWSVSMYNPDGFYVPNKLDRYHLAQRMPMQYNPDGSLDIYIQSKSPGADKEANWLPAPQSGPFNLVTRIFWPEKTALDHTWEMPGVTVVKSFVSRVAN